MNLLDTENRKRNEFLSTCLVKNLAFYVYSLPETSSMKFGVQINDLPQGYQKLSNLKGKEGFVFAPFDQKGKHESYFIRKDLDEDDFQNENLDKIEDYNAEEDSIIHESTRKEYSQQMDILLSQLNQKELDKVILSRIHILNQMGREKALTYFLKLIDAYPNAFVFMVDIPKIGLWIGASPERLISQIHNTMETVALAGTQKLGERELEDVVWEEKEIEEQSFVSSYIEELLNENQITNYKRKGPFTSQAGNLVHLKTIYQINSNLSFDQSSSFAEALHPTPAVCGLPKMNAMELIRTVENHDREYYAGYLGPVHANGDMSLFVNLRSMKVFENKMALFVGGGITSGSDPTKEWDETCFKAQTLLNVIK
ncbi:isochorismate synthase [Marinifilum sp. N1E240]|uniref:isochorismate synthase n=1 Tax=Marinifilum sp. N1E240 TaxID=2608082 RepID=UPI00128B694D|nr:isochorismate synthase [Marinifilum sp. N1E240]MPQ47880.1 isochorismate synthase [Marinifilum sp. N1E240]